MKDFSAIAGRLKEARETLKMNEAHFASRLGITEATYQKYERGIWPDSEIWTDILLFFSGTRVRLEWLLKGVKPMMTPDEDPEIRITQAACHIQNANASLELAKAILRPKK